MEVGAVAESVQVTAAAPLLETETSTTGTIVDGEYFARMPLFQRHSRGVLYLTPGVNVGGLAYAGSLGGFSINGGATGNIGYFEDGMYGVQPSGTNTTDTILSTIEEVKVITTVAAGRIRPLCRRRDRHRQEERHQSASRRRRPSLPRRADAASALHAARAGSSRPATACISISRISTSAARSTFPKLYDGRNKTFFMFAGQYLMERQGEQISWSVPTPAGIERRLQLRRHGTRRCVNQIYDPRTTTVNNGVWSRTPFPGNIIPKSQWDPVATKFLSQKVWEAPNLAGTPTATGVTGNLLLPRQKTVDWANYSLRMDQQFGSKFKMFYNWSFNTRTAFTPNLDVVDLLYNSSQRTGIDAQTTTGLGATYTISPDDDQRDAPQLLPVPQRYHLARLWHRLRRAARHPQHRHGQHARIINRR